MEPEKAFVREDDTAVIKCPQCRRAKTISVARFKDTKKILKIKCSCKETFSISLEFRRMYRKQVNLPGIFINHGRDDAKSDMIVRDLSMGGIGFTVPGDHQLKPEDELTVRFNLDDAHNSRVERRVMVRGVRGEFIGCQYLDTSGYDKALGFYLMP